MHCGWARTRIGQYIELDLGSIEEALVRFHLARCANCNQHYEQSETVAGLLATLPVPRPSSRLGVRILSALSIEAVRRDQPSVRRQRFMIKVGNLLRPIAVPALGGVLVALILVPTLLSAFWMEPTAYADDIPLRFLAEPLVAAPVMARPSPYRVVRDCTVIAYIDMQGDVYDYRVVSDEPLDQRMQGELANALLTSKFQPAIRFGQPILGQRVILYQRIDSRA